MSDAAPKHALQRAGPLAGVTVIDLTRVLAGPYCTMVLGDLGARIIKVEMPPFGDDTRRTGPFTSDDPTTRTSGYFFSVNRNKESIALDLKSEADKVVFDGLLARADVIVENFTPGTLARLGYSWEILQKAHPRLILASISGFGQTGPDRELPAYDMVVQAMGGIMSLTGEAGGSPTRVGVSIGDLAAGLFGVIGVQSALIERSLTNRGKHVDVAMLDCQVALLENAIARAQLEGAIPGPIGSRHPSITPFAVYAAKDAPIVIAAGNDAMFARLSATLGRPELARDPRFSDNPARCANHDRLKVEIETALAENSASIWITRLRADGVACGPLNTIADVFQDAQVAARGMLVPLKTDDGYEISVAGSPIQFVGELPRPFAPAPALDEHGEQLRREAASASLGAPVTGERR